MENIQQQQKTNISAILRHSPVIGLVIGSLFKLVKFVYKSDQLFEIGPVF